jgi:hypothetical protein
MTLLGWFTSSVSAHEIPETQTVQSTTPRKLDLNYRQPDPQKFYCALAKSEKMEAILEIVSGVCGAISTFAYAAVALNVGGAIDSKSQGDAIPGLLASAGLTTISFILAKKNFGSAREAKILCTSDYGIKK